MRTIERFVAEWWGLILMASMMLIIVGVLYYAISSITETCYDLGNPEKIELVARAWNANDKLKIDMPNGEEYIMDYGGQNYNSTMHLFKCETFRGKKFLSVRFELATLLKQEMK